MSSSYYEKLKAMGLSRQINGLLTTYPYYGQEDFCKAIATDIEHIAKDGDVKAAFAAIKKALRRKYYTKALLDIEAFHTAEVTDDNRLRQRLRQFSYDSVPATYVHPHLKEVCEKVFGILMEEGSKWRWNPGILFVDENLYIIFHTPDPEGFAAALQPAGVPVYAHMHLLTGNPTGGMKIFWEDLNKVDFEAALRAALAL